MAVLERALERATQRTVDRVIDELGQDLQVEEVGEVLPGQIVIDIRHPDAQEDEPLALEGVEVQALPFYAINSRFKELDANRQYLLYCDKGVMSACMPITCSTRGTPMCVFIVRLKQPGLFGGSIRHRPPDTVK